MLERQRSSPATAFEIWNLELLWDLELVIWNFDLRRDLLSGQGVSVPGGTHPSFNHARRARKSVDLGSSDLTPGLRAGGVELAKQVRIRGIADGFDGSHDWL